jgi:hypothetical protein
VAKQHNQNCKKSSGFQRHNLASYQLSGFFQIGGYSQSSAGFDVPGTHVGRTHTFQDDRFLNN